MNEVVSLESVVILSVPPTMSGIRLQEDNDIGDRVSTWNVNIFLKQANFDTRKKILLGQLGFIRFYQEEGKGKLGVILPETFNKFSQEINL